MGFPIVPPCLFPLNHISPGPAAVIPLFRHEIQFYWHFFPLQREGLLWAPWLGNKSVTPHGTKIGSFCWRQPAKSCTIMLCVLWSKQQIDHFFYLSMHCLVRHSRNCFFKTLFWNIAHTVFMCPNTLLKLLSEIIFIIGTDTGSTWNHTTSGFSVAWHATIIRNENYREKKWLQKFWFQASHVLGCFPEMENSEIAVHSSFFIAKFIMLPFYYHPILSRWYITDFVAKL